MKKHVQSEVQCRTYNIYPLAFFCFHRSEPFCGDPVCHLQIEAKVSPKCQRFDEDFHQDTLIKVSMKRKSSI